MSRRSICNRLPARGSRFTPQATVPAFIDNVMGPARSGLSPTAVVRRMASDMRDAAYREGGLTERGMKLLGYTDGQIKQHADDARVLADQLAGMTA